ncbi:Phr family secreted Rap phosphatase inhibitor [Bacillus pseudomycoides]|uniref:Phr family secreted Rap phosphatase inhibitor n=1 Tax=Bacillus bingmayongensis TaxID=1150157 RepID=A0ABU5K314_9BACI|nr:Phr family secreted Rap phosphatase inhibitor [Bacillus pseudomycoides]
MKKITSIITGLVFTFIVTCGLNISSETHQATKDISSKSNPPIVQYSHAETW